MRALEVFLLTLGGIWQGVRQDFNLLEIAVLAVCWWAWKRGWRPDWAWKFSPRRPALWALAIALGGVGVRLALLPWQPVPVPVVSDEFSHRLLADTLLHGRVTNPTHALWQHFESLHIIQQPHYVSNYFPGHAAFLSLGMWALENAWAGVLVESALFLAALYWCLRGFAPSRWALFGVLVAALRFCVASYWINAYHGGLLPALGGALVLGACVRLARHVTGVNSLALGMGCAALLVSRPFEGAFFCLPAVAMVMWQRRFRGLARPATVCAAFVGLAAVALGMYFSRVTGSPFVTAYQISQKTYGWPMALAWTPPPVVAHRHVELAAYYRYESHEHEKVSDPVNFVEFLTFRLQEYWRFFLGPLLTLPFLFWRRTSPLALAALAGTACAILLEGASSPHYFAPATAAILVLLVGACRGMQASGVRIAAALPVAMASILLLRVAAEATGLPFTQDLNYQSWCCRVTGNLNKARIAETLERTPGQHLVLVRPKTDEYNLLQWIYNAADIDASRIVWARDLGGDGNSSLLRYYATRQVWMVDPNTEPATLTPLRGPLADAGLSSAR